MFQPLHDDVLSLTNLLESKEAQTRFSLLREDQWKQEWEDSDHWSGGIYFCKKDPRFLVPKRVKWTGWTINFGHKWSPLGMVLLIVVAMACVTIPAFVAGSALTSRREWPDRLIETAVANYVDGARKERASHFESIDFATMFIVRNSGREEIEVFIDRGREIAPRPSKFLFLLNPKTGQVRRQPLR